MKHLLVATMLLNSLSIWSQSNQNQELDIILNELKIELGVPSTEGLKANPSLYTVISE